ncbi:MAG: type 4a pilus biogenesis protein PilO [candidate division WOR-3 bacterium]
MEKLKSPAVIWLVGLIVYIITFMFLWNSLYSSKSRELKSIESQYKEQYARVQNLREYVKDYDRIIREKDSLLALWEETQRYLPQEERMEEWLSQLTSMAITSGVQIYGFRPQPPRQKELYREYPVTMKVRGGYHELGTFVSFVANSERIMGIENLELQKLSAQDIEGSQTVDAELTVLCYVYSPTQVASSGGKK